MESDIGPQTYFDHHFYCKVWWSNNEQRVYDIMIRVGMFTCLHTCMYTKKGGKWNLPFPRSLAILRVRPSSTDIFFFKFYITRNCSGCFVPGLVFLICIIFSKSILPYLGWFSVLNTDNPSASCHLLVVTMIVYTCTRSVSKGVHV